MEELQLSDYLSILRKNVRLCGIVAILVFIPCVIFALSWSTYKATAMIEIAQPDVPDSVIDTKESKHDAMESMAEFRINRIQQKVLSTGSLVEIITKFDLYSKKRKTKPIAVLAEKMRSKVKISFLSGSEKQSASNNSDPIAFSLTFSYSNPLVTQQVANELISRFIDEDMKDHRLKAQEISAFLESQIKSLDTSLAEQEKQIADFRSANGDIRPDALAFNQQASASASMSLQNIDTQITTNLGTQGALKAQLASIDPYSRIVGNDQVLTTPSLMLRGLKSEYASLRAKYGPEHPDVLKAGHQVEALEAQLGETQETGPLKARLADIRTQLAAAQKTYGPENPTLISLQNQEKSLLAQIDEEKKKPRASAATKDADNPAYLNTLAQLRSTEEQYRALTAQKQTLQEQLKKYSQAVALNPEAEQKLSLLTRDYENSQLRYRELKAKKMSADMSLSVEQDRTGERLVVINPPELPLKTSPARFVFLFAGLLFAGLAGLVVSLGIPLLQQQIVSPGHLEALAGAPPLAVLPYVLIEEEQILISRKELKIAGIAFGVFLFLLIPFSLFVMPLDVLWAVALQRLGLY